MRELLLSTIEDLTNRSLQLREWVNPNYPCSFWSELKICINVIFDDLGLDEQPHDKIGYVLVNQAECDILGPLIEALDKVCTIIDSHQPDSAYINSPLWDRVIETAQEALKVFMANEEEAKKRNPKPWQGEDDWGEATSSSEK